MNREDAIEESQFLAACLQDYQRLLQAGLSINHQLVADRERIIRGVAEMLNRLAPMEEKTNGGPTTDTRGLDLAAGLADAVGDAGGGDRGIYRGYSEPGLDPADRSNAAPGREISPAVGSEEDISAPDDGTSDDSGDGT